MFKNYFKTAWRNFGKHKSLSFINIFGLSVGIACFCLCSLYAFNEFSFDNFHKNSADIYRVYNWTEAGNGSDAIGNVYLSMPVGPAMKRDLPDVVNYTRYIQPYEMFIKKGDEGRREEIGFADPSFFTMFSFKLEYGNPTEALQHINSLVLTEEAAKNIFGKADVVGQTLLIKLDDKFIPFVISAVAYDPPANTSFQFGILANINCIGDTGWGKGLVNNWQWASFITYVQLRTGSNLPHNIKALTAFKRKYKSAQSNTATEPATWYGLEPLKKVHTDIQFANTKVTPVDPKSIWILLSIAAGLLLVACINFTTLSVGRSAGRAKEVGTRRIVGSTRVELIFQFLTESFLLTLISVIMGLLLAQMLLPSFNALSGRQLAFSFTQYPPLIILLVGLVLVVSILAGIYPSLVLSGFKPIEILKSKGRMGGNNFFTRSLVIFQFAVSTALVVGAFIVMEQLHYMQSKYPGFNKENVIVAEALGVENTSNVYELFKHELSPQPLIQGIASAESGIGFNEGSNRRGLDYKTKSILAYQYYVDVDFIPVMGIQMLAGRNFSSKISSDTSNAVIINEAMMQELGLTANSAAGQRLTGYYGNGEGPVIIGVVKNFNFMGLQNKVEPQMFLPYSMGNTAPARFFVRIKPGEAYKALAAIEAAWKRVAPDYPFRYNFLDESVAGFYTSEKRLNAIVAWAAGLSMLLACLGLFGLTILAAINRTKEIGIRKVLGASVLSILHLLSKDFLKRIALAFVIAAPVTWYSMNQWLKDYAYRVNISWQVFAISGIGLAIIALATISAEAIRAAMTNPVKSLRTE